MSNISFTEHPASVGESYVLHLWHAAGFGLRLVAAGSACLVHALLPWLCSHTARDAVLRLHTELQQRSAAAESPSRNASADAGETNSTAHFAVGAD